MTAQLKAFNLNANLLLAMNDATIALKRGHWRRASDSLVAQAAILRFLVDTRPDCPHLAAFLAEPASELHEQIRAVSCMTTVPPTEAHA